jgi:hypothetical protein
MEVPPSFEVAAHALDQAQTVSEAREAAENMGIALMIEIQWLSVAYNLDDEG